MTSVLHKKVFAFIFCKNLALTVNVCCERPLLTKSNYLN